METLLRREFEVEGPPSLAWERLADVEDWPSWAPHIVRAELSPPGALGPETRGTFVLRPFLRTCFAVTELEPPRRWRWEGTFLGLVVGYDHAFEDLGSGRTRLVWTVEAEGFGLSILGPLLAALYARNLDRAIPRLRDALRRAANRR
jgi:hypothetical protein